MVEAWSVLDQARPAKLGAITAGSGATPDGISYRSGYLYVSDSTNGKVIIFGT
jgi:hypothetical protein